MGMYDQITINIFDSKDKYKSLGSIVLHISPVIGQNLLLTDPETMSNHSFVTIEKVYHIANDEYDVLVKPIS